MAIRRDGVSVRENLHSWEELCKLNMFSDREPPHAYRTGAGSCAGPCSDSLERPEGPGSCLVPVQCSSGSAPGRSCCMQRLPADDPLQQIWE